MRSVSLSKYLSKFIHVFTSFVYLFTFLGPSLAQATEVVSYTQTLTLPKEDESFSVQLRPTVDSSSLDLSLERPLIEQELSLPIKTNEQQIFISKGWGAQSLYFGIDQTTQHLVSPLALSMGKLPYKEVTEDGYSIGFQGSLPDLGQFLCCWDGELLLQGNQKEDPFSSTTNQRTLVLETFAPVTFSNFVAKAVQATAKRIFFRGENALDEATLTPTKDSDLDAFCQTALGSITSIKDLILRRGVLTNFGAFTADSTTIGQGASFVNGGHATIATLRGQGLFLNHGVFDGLVKLSILRFINRTNAFFAPRAECHFEDVSIAGATSQFLNDEDALFEANTLVFERNQVFRPSALQNKGKFTVRDAITLKGRNFINNGTATLTGVDLQNEAQVINKEGQTISGVRSLKLSGGSTVKNSGTFATQGVVAYDIFMLLANQEAGHWDHEGDVELDKERVTTTGSVSLKNGLFLTDGWRYFTNRGSLELHDFSINKGGLSIHNNGQLVLSNLPTTRPYFSIYNKINSFLRLTDNQQTTFDDFLVYNSGTVELSSSNRLTYHLTNMPCGQVHFDKGIHRIAYFINKGKFHFADTNWHLGQDSPKNRTVFASEGFLEDVAFLDLVSLQEGTKAAYQVESTLLFPKNLTYRLAYTPKNIEVLGDFHLPLLESKRPRSLTDLKDVICHGETHVTLPTLTLTEDLTFKNLKSLHITCAEAIKILATLKAPEIFFKGQKGFDLGTDNTHFGEISATEGRLSITVQDALNAKYGNLHSMQKMVLRSEKDRVDLGEMVAKTASRVGGYYTFYDPNNSFVATNGALHIYAAKGGSNKGLVWVGGDLNIEIPDPLLEQLDFPFENIAGHIHVWGNADINLQSMINKRLPVVRFKTPYSGGYDDGYCEDTTSRAAQFHVQGHLKTQTPTFHNIASLVRVVGNFTGDAEQLFEGIQQGGSGAGWRNLKSILNRNGHHKKHGWHCLSHPDFSVESEINGIFSIGGEFVPPTSISLFESSGLIEARLARLMYDGPLILTGDGSSNRSLAQIRPIDSFMPQNGLFVENTDTLSLGPVIQERFQLGGQFTDEVSTAPRLIIPSLKRRLMLEGSRLPRQMPKLPRDLLSSAALAYTLTTGVMPFLDRKYQHLSPLELCTGLQNNSVTYLKNLSLLRGSNPLYSLEGPTESVPNGNTLLLRDSTAFVSAPNVTEPMMAFVEEEINGETVLVPYIALPPKDLGSGTTRMDEHLTARVESVSLTGALLKSIKSYVDVKARGPILTLPFYEKKVTSGGKRTTITEFIPHVSGIEAATGIRLETSSDQVHVGSQFKAGDEYEIFLKAASLRLLAAQRTKETVTKKKKGKGNFSRLKELHTTSNPTTVKETKTTFESTPVPLEMKGGKARLVATEGDLEDQASRILTKHGIDFESKKGKILLKMAFKQFHHAVQRSTESLMWNRFKDEGSSSKTGVEGVKDPGDGEIKMKAFDGIEYEHRADSSLKDFLSLALKDEQNVIWRAINDESDSWCEESESLGIVAAAAIVIVVTYFTAGAGSGVAGPLMSAGMNATVAAGCATAVSAGVSAIASQAALSIINNGGDFRAVAKELTSSQAMKSLAVTMVSAGVCGELLKALDIGTAISGDIGQQVLSRTQEAAIRTGVNTVLKSTIEGRNFAEVLTEEARSGAANVVGGTLANKVGVEYKAKDSDINYVMHKIIHGVIGGISGLISGGTEEAFAAAIGATIGEIVGEGYEKAHRDGVYDPNHPSFNAKEREDMVRKGTMFSELSAAVFAGVLGQDPNAAARAANNAVTENAFLIRPTLQRQTIEETGEIIGYVLDNSPAETTEELAGDFYEVLSNLNHLDLSDDQAQSIAHDLAARIASHEDSLSGRQINKLLQKSLLEYAGPTAEQKKFEKDLGNLGELGGKKGVELLGGSKELQNLTGGLGKLAGKGLAFGMGLYDNPGTSGVKKAVKETVKEVAKEGTKKTAKKTAKKPQTYEVKAGKEWKAKIRGKAQVTGGKKKPDVIHSWKSRKEAIRAAKRPDVVEVQMDLGVNRLLPKSSKIAPKGNRRPDVAYKTKDGKISQIEVPSKTDKVKDLRNRMEDTANKFPKGMDGEIDVIIRKFD